MAPKKKPKPSAPKQKLKRAPPRPEDAPAPEPVVEETTAPRPALPFPVVGVGASAGGLDAFKKFFAAMPPSSGVAFILIPHLDPTHRSMMVELIARHTSMPVLEAADKQRVEANRIYIIPPNKYMRIADGVLNLTGPVDRRAASTPIDLFLRSLADDQQERAICVILSGTGAHGSLGLKAVKEAGGMAMVQDPQSAEYDRMPLSAIATGLADFVLPPEKLPDALCKYVRHFYLGGNRGEPALEEAPSHLSKILALLRARTKHDFTCYRKKMVRRRVERRMGIRQIADLAAYCECLRDNPDEIKHLSRDLFISVTSFFRDPEALHALETQVIPQLVECPDPDVPVRIWIPGCATGEEAYTIGMLLLEYLAKAQVSCPLQIFATDVDEEALAVARQAVYPESIAADVSPERLTRFFSRAGEHHFKVNQQLRESVIFAVQDLIADPPFSRLDFISCRNLLIYLEPDIQQKVLGLMHFALNDKGFLLLGSSETIGRHVGSFKTLNKKWRIYQRVGSVPAERLEIPVGLRPIRHGAIPRLREPANRRPAGSFADVTNRLLLQQYAPAAVLVNDRHEILHYHGPTTRYLENPGEPTHDLVLLARDGLRAKLRALLHKVSRDKRPVTEADIRFKRNGDQVSATITVRPVQAPNAADGMLLVTFEEQRAVSAHKGPPPEMDEPLVRQLEYELKTTHEDLQNTIEELESSNEELRAANEEVMSMNEELQSGNEELEMSKEELQSLNEEMTTVNSQLQEKVEDAENAANDMANLLNSTEIGTLFLDADFRVKLFTPAAARLFNLIDTDIGRPIRDITYNFTDPALLDDVQRVLRQLTPLEKEVATNDERWCIRRVAAYRTVDNRIEGVVITMVDITRRRHSELELRLLTQELEQRINQRTAELRDREEFVRTILANAAEGIVVIDQSGTVQTFNQAAEKMFGYRADEVIGREVKMLAPFTLQRQIERELTQYLTTGHKAPGARRQVEGRRKDGATFPMELAISESKVGGRRVFTGILRDVSESRALEKEILEIAAGEQRRIGQDLHDGVGQELTGLGLLAGNLLEEVKQSCPDQTELSQKIGVGLKRVLGQVRALSQGLLPVEVDAEGLMTALQELAGRISDQAGIRCTFQCDTPVRVEDNAVATHLFRIAQEAVANALTHGKARTIDIGLVVSSGFLRLTIEDDGGGIRLPAKPDGLGLKIMQYRANLIGATFQVEPGEDGGTLVTCALHRGEQAS